MDMHYMDSLIHLLFPDYSSTADSHLKHLNRTKEFVSFLILFLLMLTVCYTRFLTTLNLLYSELPNFFCHQKVMKSSLNVIFFICEVF